MQQDITFHNRILEVLGVKSSRLSIVTSASLAILCLFYVYTVGTFLQIRIYPLIDRVTYYTNFNFYIVNEFVDHIVIGCLLTLWLALSIRSKIGHMIVGAFAPLFVAAAVANYDAALDGIALAALPTIITLMIYNWYSPRKILDNRRSSLTLNYLAIIGIITGLISFSITVYSIGFPDNEPVMRSYAHEIFVLFSSFSPVLMLILITSFPVKLIINFLSGTIRRIQTMNLMDEKKTSVTIRLKIFYLCIFVSLSILMVLIPHLPMKNEDNQPISVDSRAYSSWLGELKNSKDIQEYFRKAFVDINNGDRPISLMLMLTFQQALTAGGYNEPVLAIEYLPFLLGPGFVLVIYFLTRELTSNDKVSLLAAFITSISFQVLIGLYAGFYSNWISLILGYLSLIFLLKFVRQRGIINLALYGFLMTLTLFTHVYTWSILAIVMGLFVAIGLTRWNTFMQNRQYGYKQIRKNAMLVLAVLLSTVAIDIARVAITGSSGGIEGDLELGNNLVGIDQFALRWNNLTYGTTIYVGGLFANFIVLGLGLYWLFTSRMMEKQNILMIVFLSIGILPFLFGEWIIQTRVLYNIPFQIPAALAIFNITKRSSGLLRTIPIFIWIITASVVVVSNFYPLLPE